MKVVVAPDSFKGSLSAVAAARAMARGVRAAAPRAEVVEVPVADGGEGTVDALVAATGGKHVEARVRDPLGRPIRAKYGILGDGKTAIIEMAAASGLPLLRPRERNPMVTSTYGTGEMILDAVKRGAREVIIGIGGSATVDGGTGMARALGIKFLDAGGGALEGGGEILRRIRRIDLAARTALIRGVRIVVACDVTNPLTGPRGAAFVYGPQKGATPEMVAALDRGLRNLARRMREDLGRDVELAEGAGAAGGLGAGLVAFLGATLRRGVDIVLGAVGFEKKLRGARVVFTGEGRADIQSAYGKAVSGVARMAKSHRVPCILLAGGIGEGAARLHDEGVTAIFSIADGPAAEDEMMSGAAALLRRASEQATRTFLAGAGRPARRASGRDLGSRRRRKGGGRTRSLPSRGRGADKR